VITDGSTISFLDNSTDLAPSVAIPKTEAAYPFYLQRIGGEQSRGIRDTPLGKTSIPTDSARRYVHMAPLNSPRLFNTIVCAGPWFNLLAMNESNRARVEPAVVRAFLMPITFSLDLTPISSLT